MRFAKKTILHGALFAFLVGMTTPAQATSSIGCQGINSDAAVNILFGAGPLLNPLSVDVFFGDREISTQPRDGVEKAAILQFFANDNELTLELMDEQADQHLVTVRLLRLLDGDAEPLQIGFLNIHGSGPVGITCDGP